MMEEALQLTEQDTPALGTVPFPSPPSEPAFFFNNYIINYLSITITFAAVIPAAGPNLCRCHHIQVAQKNHRLADCLNILIYSHLVE